MRKMAGLLLLCGTRRMIFFVYVVTFFGLGASIDQVPFLMWSTEGLPALAAPADGHIISTGQLSTYLNTAFGSRSHTGLVFMQDKLSKDDFALYGGVFGSKQDSAFQNLEAALQSSSSSLVLPALAWHGSSTTLTLLQEKLGVTPLLVDPDSLQDLVIDTSKSNLLVLSLGYCSGKETSCKELIRSNDEIIGKVQSIMKAKSISYTAFYTGLQPSRVIPQLSMSPNGPMGRSLLQTVAPTIMPPIMFNTSGSPCIMLWAQNLYVDFNGGSNWTDLAAQTPTLDGSICNGTNSQLVLKYPSGITLSFAMSVQFYPVSARNWFTLDTVQLQYRGQQASFNGSRGIYAPAEYSFHCMSVNSFNEPLLVPNGTSPNTSLWMVNFVDFQIQGFGLANGTRFSYASDCAGFFTAGIWMGLVTTLVMLLILVYGLHMIMQLNTMDRFDDPKGPSISVPQTD